MRGHVAILLIKSPLSNVNSNFFSNPMYQSRSASLATVRFRSGFKVISYKRVYIYNAVCIVPDKERIKVVNFFSTNTNRTVAGFDPFWRKRSGGGLTIERLNHVLSNGELRYNEIRFDLSAVFN